MSDPVFTLADAGVRGVTLPGETLIEIAPEGEPRFVAHWGAFLRDNSDDDTIDWPAIARTLAAGRTWHDGGGAAPGWSVRLAPDRTPS